MTGITEPNSTSRPCICALNPHCYSSVIAYGYSKDSNGWPVENITYPVPGMIKGCYDIDTVLLSTLECYYSSLCLSVIYALINETLFHHVTDSLWFRVKPLTYERNSSRFLPNTTLSIIIRDMLIEKWNNSSSFDKYYNQCAPIFCTYSDIKRIYHRNEIAIKVMSIIGGLTMILRLITQIFMNIIFKLSTPRMTRQEQGRYY